MTSKFPSDLEVRTSLRFKPKPKNPEYHSPAYTLKTIRLSWREHWSWVLEAPRIYPSPKLWTHKNCSASIEVTCVANQPSWPPFKIVELTILPVLEILLNRNNRHTSRYPHYTLSRSTVPSISPKAAHLTATQVHPQWQQVRLCIYHSRPSFSHLDSSHIPKVYSFYLSFFWILYTSHPSNTSLYSFAFPF